MAGLTTCPRYGPEAIDRMMEVYRLTTSSSDGTTIPALEWPQLTTANLLSSSQPPRRPKVVERPAPPGKSERRRMIEARWSRRGRA